MSEITYIGAQFLASLLPHWLLSRLAHRYDTPGAFTCDNPGSSFWMDTSYRRWLRGDKRKEWFWHKIRGYRY